MGQTACFLSIASLQLKQTGGEMAIIMQEATGTQVTKKLNHPLELVAVLLDALNAERVVH